MEIIKKRNHFLLFLGVLIVAIGMLNLVRAQQAVPGATSVQQVQPFTTCNQTTTQTGAGNATVTATLTPPAGQYVYICSIYISEVLNAAGPGTAGPAPIFTTVNLQNNLVWWGDNSVSVTGTKFAIVDDVFPLFLKANTPGTAFSITMAASGAAAQNVRINITGFFAP